MISFFFVYADKVWEMHHLFLEETQGSFTEVKKTLLLYPLSISLEAHVLGFFFVLQRHKLSLEEGIHAVLY